MTVQEFKKTINKASWFGKYYYYFISLAFIGVGLFFFYQGLSDSTKYETNNLRILMFFTALFCVSLGILWLYLIPKRYKVLTFDSKLSPEYKKRIIAETMKEFNGLFIDNPKCFWSFDYQRKWWTFDYTVYLAFDNEKIFASVVGKTHVGGGFIDFGQTNKFRQKLIIFIDQKLSQT